MSDYSVVYFRGAERGFSVPSTLCDFSIGGMDFSIKFYGLFIAAGFLLALFLCSLLARRKNIDTEALYDVVILSTFFGIIGARLYYVLFNLDYYKTNPSAIFNISEGGLAIYGGVIGALLAGVFICKKRGLKVSDGADLAAVGFLIGQGIGRWGNFTNQEAFGTATFLPWGMSSDKTADYIIRHQDFLREKGIELLPTDFVHPTFLYESLWCLLGAALLAYIFLKHRRFGGEIALFYCVWYGAARALIEGLRTDSLYLGNTDIRVSQLLSLLMFLFGAVALIVNFVKIKLRDKRQD